MTDGDVSLDFIFKPASVAIAGVASERPGHYNTGRLFLDTIISFGFKGQIYPINPRGGEIAGLRVYPGVGDIPGPVDYLISCIPAPHVPQLIKDCAVKGVKAVCLFTAGFSEAGTDRGRQSEQELQRLAQTTGVRILGPNCMGTYCPGSGFSFGPDFPRESGKVALICQSGGNALYLVRAAGARGVRFSKVVSYGNACDIDECELLEYLRNDSQTEIVAAYIEGVSDGPRFRRVVQELAAVKPVLILKAGYTREGAAMTASHTGSLAGSDGVWNAIMEQVNVVRVHSLDELVDMMVTFQCMSVPRGRRIGIFGFGGGASVLATDECASAGLSLPPLNGGTGKAILETIRAGAGAILDNPVDLWPEWVGDAVYREVLRKMCDWDGIDLLVFQIPLRGVVADLPTASSLFESQVNNVIQVSRESKKPMAVVVHYLANGESWQVASRYAERLRETGLPVFFSTASAFRAIDRFMRYQEGKGTIPTGPEHEVLRPNPG
ncbi:MAG: CoA-binding protein [Chloroflexi bacterium]|nr:CoA-binding protein [Chloroflexota bacterium]